MRAGQRGTASQRELRLLGRTQRQRCRRIQRRLDQRDVDPGTHHEHTVRPGGQARGAGHQPGQRGDRRVVVVGKNLATDVGDSAVGRVDDGQRRGVGFDEQQSGATVAGCAAHRLRQRRRGQKRRDQHDILQLAGRQCVAQRCGLRLVAPRHPGGNQLVAGLGGAFPGTEDRGDHLVGCGQRRRAVTVGKLAGKIVGKAGGEIKAPLVDGDTVGVFALEQHHAYRPGCHRDPEHGIHDTSTAVTQQLTGRRGATMPSPHHPFIAAAAHSVIAALSRQLRAIPT